MIDKGLIIDYINNESSSLEREIVEIKILTEPNFNHEYKVFSKLNDTISSGFSKSEPPSNISNKIFNEIGIKQLLVENDNYYRRYFYSKSNFKEKFQLIISSTLVALLISFITILLYKLDINKNDTLKHSSIFNKPVNSFGSLMKSSEYGANNKILNNKDKKALNEKIDYQSNNNNQIIRNFSKVDDSKEITLLNNNYDNNNLSLINISRTISGFWDTYNEKQRFFKPIYKTKHEIFKNNNLKFSYEFRGNFNKGIKSEIIPSESSAMLYNCTIGIFYKNSGSINFGLELNQEAFTLLFSEIKDDEKKEYKKGINFSSYELASRFYINLSEKIVPYVQLNLGFNKSGIITRAEIGGLYKIDNQFGIVTSLKLSNMFYQFNNEIESSTKAGISLGFSYSLN